MFLSVAGHGIFARYPTLILYFHETEPQTVSAFIHDHEKPNYCNCRFTVCQWYDYSIGYTCVISYAIIGLLNKRLYMIRFINCLLSVNLHHHHPSAKCCVSSCIGPTSYCCMFHSITHWILLHILQTSVRRLAANLLINNKLHEHATSYFAYCLRLAYCMLL